MQKTLEGIIKAGKENLDTKVEGEEEDFGCICEIDLSQTKKLTKLLNELLVKHIQKL
jgi:hypothetical protein